MEVCRIMDNGGDRSRDQLEDFRSYRATVKVILIFYRLFVLSEFIK